MGRVWRALDQQLGVDVAVKEVFRRPGIPDDYWQELLVRARREARHGARLREHPNIVAVYDVVVEDGIPWTVMRLVKGESLEERLRSAKKGVLPVGEAARIAVGILKALGAAHDAGIVHRDVKPANIMLADGGGVLLTDFGIAVDDADTKLTQDGSVIGSMAYIAPERADGAQGGPPGDLFSLGVTLYQALEGVSPFQRDTLTGTLRAVAAHEPPPPTRAGHLAPLITALLRKEPGARPTVAEALAMARRTTAAMPPKGGVKPAPRVTDAVCNVVLQRIGRHRDTVIALVGELAGIGPKKAKDLVDSSPPRLVLTNVDRATATIAKAALAEVGATATITRREPGFWADFRATLITGLVLFLFGIAVLVGAVLQQPTDGERTSGALMFGISAMSASGGAPGAVFINRALWAKTKEDTDLRTADLWATAVLGVLWTTAMTICGANHLIFR